MIASHPRRVLIIAYHFPPAGGSGVQRPLKLAKYLSRSGWDVDVICSTSAGGCLQDPELLDDLPTSVRVHRVVGMEPLALASRLNRVAPAIVDRIGWRLDSCCRAMIPESAMLWGASALFNALRLARASRFNAVITTSPPHSTQIVGMMLQSICGIPWVADLRDPITDNFSFAPRGLFARAFWRWLEGKTIRSAARVVTTCPDLTTILSERYHRPLTTIMNGFDDEDVRSVSPRPSDGKCRLVYAGSFYQQQSLEPLLTALREIAARQPATLSDLEVRLVGSIAKSLQSLITPDDSRFLKIVGYTSHRDALREMSHADALFLTTPSEFGGRLCIPAKTFEYLRFGKHILAVVHPHTAIENMLRRAGNTTVVTDLTAPALARSIEHCYDQWKAGSLQQSRDESIVRAYDRRTLASQYAALIADLSVAPVHASLAFGAAQ